MRRLRAWVTLTVLNQTANITMQKRALDPRLAADTYLLGYFDRTAVLLLRNAHYPWMILVPDTDEIDFHKLSVPAQAELMAQAGRLATFIESWTEIDKMNVACIGNVVSQLHLHVVGRRKTDPSWPGVVWGAKAQLDYQRATLMQLHQQLSEALGDDFQPSAELNV